MLRRADSSVPPREGIKTPAQMPQERSSTLVLVDLDANQTEIAQMGVGAGGDIAIGRPAQVEQLLRRAG